MLRRVSSRFRPFCHPDTGANGITRQQFIPMGSACADYSLQTSVNTFHPSTDQLTSQDNQLSPGLRLSHQYTQSKREGLQRELLLSAKLATGQPSSPRANKDIKFPSATPAACARSRQCSDKAVRKAGKVIFHHANLRTPALPQTYTLSETSCDNPSKLGYIVATFSISTEWTAECRKVENTKENVRL